MLRSTSLRRSLFQAHKIVTSPGFIGSNSSKSLATAAAKTLPQFIINAPATEVTTLPNGIRVASEGGHGETATVGVWIDAGSRFETAENNGAAHFLEHMFFKGTPKRSQHQLEVEIENLGAHLNAYTSREQTVYYAKCFKADLPKCVEILADILTNASLNEAAIERERDVILREMQEVEKEQEEVVFDRLHETAFQGSGLGRTILGPKENIRNLSKTDLKEYIKTHYLGEKMVIAAAGSVDHKQLVELTTKHFGSIKNSAEAKGSSLILPPKPKFIGSELRVRDDTKDAAHIAIAFESLPWKSPDAFCVMLLQTLIGCWDRTSSVGANTTSLLCSTIAERELAHSIMAFNTCYSDTGLFGIYTVTKDEDKGQNLQDLIYYTMEALVSLGYNVTQQELDRAKVQLKTLMLAQLDGSSAVAEDIGRQILTYGRRLSPAEIFKRIDMIELNQVKKVAREIIEDKDPAIAAIGCVHEMPDYNYVRRKTYWKRV